MPVAHDCAGRYDEEVQSYIDQPRREPGFSFKD
jgi:hypothetical protein